MSALKKEKCNSCEKYVNIGQCITECAKCMSVIHSKCFSKSKFKMANKNYYCDICYPSIIIRYNPYKNLNEENDSESDHFFNQSPCLFMENFTEASNILENCQNIRSQEVEPLLKDNQNNFNTLFYNIDGNKSNFNVFVTEIVRLQEELSFIGLAETNVNSDQKDLYPLDNFKSYYSDKLENKKSGTGVALYVNKKFNVMKNIDASVTKTHLESLFLHVSKDKLKANVGVVYRPPNSCFNDFIDDMRNIMKTLPKTITYILGDFNLDLHKSEVNSNIGKFEEFFMSEGLFPVVSISTHHNKSKNSKSCIDNIFTNKTESINYSGVVGNCGSGHFPIFSTSKLDYNLKPRQKEKITQYYNFSHKNTDNFVKKLEENANTLIGNDPTTPPNFSIFLEKYKEYLDESCKLAIPKKTVRNIINNPWINDSIISAIARKDELYKNWKSTCTKNNPDGNRDLHKIFSDYRRVLKHIVTYEKKKYNHEKFEKASGDPKKTWEIINQLRGKHKREIKPVFIINNKRITERRVIANEFNKYFVAIAGKLNESVQIEPGDYKSFLPKSQMHSMFLSDCTAEEVNTTIAELQTGKSSDIPIGIIKKTAKIISPILSYHFNYLMEIGQFPDELKLGKITPIYKKENEEFLENYRPVSTLPIFGKIFEKIIYSRLYNYFTSKGILHDKQFGFRKFHSTSHALNYSTDLIRNSLEKGDHVLGIFIDLSKAFDTIDHKILIEKLEHYGVRGKALSLLQSYLYKRNQCVSTLGEVSENLTVMFGVPQGSCLGPLLFLIYVNDVSNVSKTSEMILFADDTNIFVKAKSKQEVYNKANRILKQLSKYTMLNKLHINLEKSCFMDFSKATTNTILDDEDYQPIIIGTTEISKVSETKFLGVTIDDRLSWNAHIKALSKKLASCTGSINQIATYIPENLFMNLYHTLFESYLTYGITVWGSMSDTKLKRLFIAQKKIVRVLFGDREKFIDKFKTCVRARPYPEQKLPPEFYIKEHSKPLFNKNQILNLKNLYTYHCANETFKIMKFKSPIAIHDLFTFSNRGHKQLFIITPRPNDTYLYTSSAMWNKIRNILQINDSSISVSFIKQNLKKHLLNVQTLGDRINWIENNFFS